MSEEKKRGTTKGSDPAKTGALTDEVRAKLTEFGATDEAIDKIRTVLGVERLDDLGVLIESDLTGVGIKPVQARKLLASLKKPDVAVIPDTMNNFNFEGILPNVPDDTSWLKALKAGGVLKVDQSSVIAAIRAALAHRVGFFDVPSKIVTAMEEFAEKNEDPVDPVFFTLRKQLIRRNYGDIFSAIDGMDGSYVSDKLKKVFFAKMEQYFFPEIASFYNALKAWQESWMQGAANPMVLMASIVGRGAALPPGILQAPDTGILRDNGEAVNDAINKAFAGMGVQIAAALAYDAIQIKNTLEDSRLPALVGAANRDQMLKQINAAVNSTYPRLEANLTRFVLGAMQAKDLPGGEEELQYFSALYMLGSQIPWDQLGVGAGITAIGGRRTL